MVSWGKSFYLFLNPWGKEKEGKGMEEEFGRKKRYSHFFIILKIKRKEVKNVFTICRR